MSRRKIAIAIGFLFLSSTVTFMLGSSLIDAFVGGSGDKASLVTGVLLEIYTGLAVAGIGVLAYPILKTANTALAFGYAGLRIAECLAIAACGIYLLSHLKLVPHYDLIIYVFTGTGGLVFSYLLYVSRVVPRTFSVLGLVGYAVLLAGLPLALLGLTDLDKGLGFLFYVPGGLFEFVLPIWLIAKGFKAPVRA